MNVIFQDVFKLFEVFEFEILEGLKISKMHPYQKLQINNNEVSTLNIIDRKKLKIYSW